ncbi:hypothetical protein F5876DRAFT_80780 [Lentinula aff. lateritia]|uniref:Uncharacterized protein n=1 Tax=Lentinula aff. lateritia TaxID=2804960 RepID=A0ACC1TNN9_9AGAR|nr:hypothetical protein F5876DRAFT_80780 [Lentinula aff. lateritia]
MPVNHKYTLSTSNNTTFLNIPAGHALDLFTHILGLISSLFAILKKLVTTTTLLDSNSNSTNKIPANASTYLEQQRQAHQAPPETWYQRSGRRRIRVLIYSTVASHMSSAATKIRFFNATLNAALGCVWDAFTNGDAPKYVDIGQALNLKEVLLGHEEMDKGGT